MAHRIKQIQYNLRGYTMVVTLYDGRKRVYHGVSEDSRKRLANVQPEYDYRSEYEKAQNAIYNPGFHVWRVRDKRLPD